MLTGNKKPTLLAVNAAISKPVLSYSGLMRFATDSKISFFFSAVRFGFSFLEAIRALFFAISEWKPRVKYRDDGWNVDMIESEESFVP